MKHTHCRLVVFLMALILLLAAYPMSTMADETTELIIEDVFTDDSEDTLDILEDDLSQAPEVIDSDDDIILGPIEDFTDLNTATDWMNLDETPVLDEAVDNEAVPNASDTRIGDYSYTFANGLATITGYSGSNTTLTLPDKVIYEGTTYDVTGIGGNAFKGSNITAITIPAKINSLGKNVFEDCVNLTSVTVNGDIKDTLESWPAFYNTGTSSGGFSVTFGSGVTRVPANLFYTNSSKVDNTYAHVNKVSLPDSITEIGNDAFNNCFDLKSVIYAGSQSEWDSVTVGKNNDPLLSASFTYGQGGTVAVTSVTLNRISLMLPVGATATLTAKVIPAKATDKTVVWSSSDPDVVTVEDGKIKALGEGSATVTATSASDSSKRASCEITVPKPPSKVTLNKKKATLVVGAKLTLKARLKPTGAKTTLKWTSSNNKVAKVTSKGVVKALKKGTATITVRTANGKKATCKITVPTAPTKIQFAKKQYSVKKGKKITLKTSLTPAAAKTTLTWSSDNKKIATVTKKGVVKGIRKGTVTITVKTANGKSATVKVTVK